MGDQSALSAGGVVGGFGIALSGLHLLHGIGEIPGEADAVLYGVVLPLMTSFLIVPGGYWIARRDWSDVSPWRIVVWCSGGVVVGVGLSAVLIRYQAAEDVSMSDPLFVLAMFGTYGGAVGLLVGRYDVQRRTQHLQQTRKTARLDEFAGIVSHDLRNPLDVAKGHLELARQEPDGERFDAIARAHDRMERLIEDLLTLAREGEGTIEPEAVELDGIVRSCWRNVETERATIVVDTTRTIRADPDRLRQLLENLLRNAVEHGSTSPDSGARQDAGRASSSEPSVADAPDDALEHNGEDVTITVGDLDGGFYVADDGPGIPEGKRDQVFERGYSTSRDGTGFGLAIVAAIAETHGWTVSVTESDEGGARFEITGVETV